MPSDLIFSQSIPRNASTGIQNDKAGPSGLDRSSRIQPYHKSPQDDGENFLATLKQISQDRMSTKQPPPAGKERSSRTSVPAKTGAAMAGEIGEASDHAATQVEMTAQNESEAEPDPMPTEWNFMALIKWLKDMGLHDAIGGSNSPNMAGVNPADANQLAAIKMLMARLQQNQFVPTADLKAGFESLQQLIANALEAKIPAPLEGNSGRGLSPNQMTDLAQFNHWLKGLISGLQDQKETSGLLLGEDASGAKPSGTMPAAAGVIAEAVGGTGIVPSAADSAVASQSENRSEMDPVKLTTATPQPDPKTQPDMSATNLAEKADCVSSTIKDASGIWRDSGAPNRTEISGQSAAAPDQNQPAGTENTSDRQPLKPAPSSGINSGAGNVSEGPIQNPSGEESHSKVLQEAQPAKEGGFKVESGMNEETVSKVSKTEAGTNDNNLLNASGQNAEKAVEAASSPKEPESGQNSLRNQAADQIVRQAAIHLRNGQHEAKIDLKPDFLGHIRMQVITENQQVTVKIVTEHGFVKDMIESNVHQLKAGFQQQGLEVDKLEVSVSGDPEDSGNSREKLAQAKTRQSTADHRNQDRPPQQKQNAPRNPPRTAVGAPTVDYFA